MSCVQELRTYGGGVKNSALRQRATALTISLLACVSLVACQGSTDSSDADDVATSSSEDSEPAAVPAGLEEFYEQGIDWQDCADDDAYQCATVEVPLDYDDPDGQTIELALKMHPADGDNPLGNLFINPGGPGGSGIDLVEGLYGYIPSEITDAYNLIGFDPRGVGASTAVDCLTDAELDEDRSAEDSALEEGDLDGIVEEIQEFEQKCEENTAVEGLLDHIDTISAARDLDVLRALGGDNDLNYLGYSYGTYLGATYADLFPENVGRMVLDGALDPSLSAAEITLGQAQGFEAALQAYVEDCQAGPDCPLKGDVEDGIKQIQQFLEQTSNSPIPTADSKRPLTYSLAESAIIGVMYQDEAWSFLTSALDAAMNDNDGSLLLYVADLFASRNDDGSYDGNGDEVIGAINCLDYPVEGDEATWEEEAEELEEASPTFGADLAYTDLYCQAWGHESTRERAEVHAEGANPILVIGTTGDPATIYEWAVALDEQLESSALLTWEGNGHTAYGRAGDCVDKAVDAYLLRGILPDGGLTCVGQE